MAIKTAMSNELDLEEIERCYTHLQGGALLGCTVLKQRNGTETSKGSGSSGKGESTPTGS